MVRLLLLRPFVQINAASSRFAGRVDGEERLDALSFTANREGVEKFVPAFRRFFKLRSFRSALEPSVEFYRHRRKEESLFDSIEKMFAEGTTPGISWRPDLDSRHDLADGVNYLLGNALGFYRARPSLFEAGVKFAHGFLRRFLRLAPANGRHRVVSTTPGLFRGCHSQILAEGVKA